jgi:hypothetical protein
MMLKTLKLSWNGITSEGAIAFSKALTDNRVLTELDLGSNRITDHGALALARTLLVNNTLAILNLAKNNIQETGASALLRTILHNSETRITKLDLTGASIKEDFHTFIEELQKQKPNVTIVTDKAPESRPRPDTPDPSTLLRNYLAREHVRIVDLFRKLDRDQSMQVSVREFVEGLRNSDVGLTTFEVEKMIESLDVDDDGEIDYSEFVSIQGMWQKPESKKHDRRMSKKV